jgi:hypothetical protein
MALLIYQRQPDEVVTAGAAPTALDDGSDFWGAIACGAVLAATACALPAPRQPVLDVDDVPAATLRGQPDEDYWQNQVPPQAATLVVQLPLGDPEEIPAGVLRGEPDEDFWVNPTPPVAASLYQRLPFLDPEELPAASLYGQPDEDAWQPPLPPAITTAPRTFALNDDLPVAATTSVVHEDDWPLPRPWPTSQPITFLDPEELPAATLYGQADEDAAWQEPLPWPLPRVAAFTDDEVLPTAPTVTIVDEDFWVAPPAQPATLFVELPLGDPEEIPAGGLRGQPDEDYWSAPPAVAAALYQRLPYLPDPEEVPVSPPVVLQPDEDFWTAPPPVPAQLWQPLPYLPDPEGRFGAVHAVDDPRRGLLPAASDAGSLDGAALQGRRGDPRRIPSWPAGRRLLAEPRCACSSDALPAPAVRAGARGRPGRQRRRDLRGRRSVGSRTDRVAALASAWRRVPARPRGDPSRETPRATGRGLLGELGRARSRVALPDAPAAAGPGGDPRGLPLPADDAARTAHVRTAGFSRADRACRSGRCLSTTGTFTLTDRVSR